MRFASLLTALLCCVTFQTKAATEESPGYWLGVEPYVVHTAPYVGPFGTTNLVGQTTYRIYLHTNSASDFLSSISGEATHPLVLNSTSTPAWHNDLAFGSNLGAQVNGSIFGFMPALQYDSWLTIGASQSVAGFTLSETTVATPWAQFNAGTNVLMNHPTGWALYGLNPCPSGVGCNYTHPGYAGDDLKILVGQITTSGTISGQMYVQVFQNGFASSEYREMLPLLAQDPNSIAGCTDEAACNFSAEATDEDGSCVFATGCDVCAGGALVDGDTDNDGVCNTNEVAGCTSVTACNFNAAATEDNGSCLYATGCDACSGGAVADGDADNDGVCDGNEIAGCTTANACNYSTTATEDDGSCDYCSCAGGDPALPTYTMTVEAHASGLVPGTTTYRFYIDMLHGTDFLSAIYGNSLSPLYLTTSSGSFYNDPFASGETAGGINPLLFSFSPTLAADSWVTIGISSAAVEPESAPFTIESSGQAWKAKFVAGSPLSGQNVAMDNFGGGAWYTVNGTVNGVPSAGTSRVLFLQMTTAGSVSGVINAQIFPQGVGLNNERLAFTFNGTGTFYPQGYVPPTPTNPCGCTDVLADNYDGSAEYEDGSCAYGGCTDLTACNYDASANTDDGTCTYPDVLGVCGGGCEADADADGVCDASDPCVGALDACGVCNGPGAVYACGCTEVPSSDCDCEGGQLDALGVCGGDCPADVDSDGVCDTEEGGCTFVWACNYNPSALFDNGTCEFFSCLGCTDPTACNFNPAAIYPNGSCEYVSCAIQGCTNPLACNFDAAATFDNGTCDFTSCVGCTDPAADNFDPGATLSDGSCIYAGCTNPAACNFESSANLDNGSCLFNDALGVCGGACEADVDVDGLCDNADPCVGALDGCGICNGPGAIYVCGCSEIPAGACDCNGNVLDALGVCGGDCGADTDGDGICNTNEVAGCTDASACNYNAAATDEDGSCTVEDQCGVCGGSGIPAGVCDCAGNQLDALGVCGGSCAVDADGDGTCDDVDPCVGALDACGICNGPGAVFTCGCSGIPSGSCDCEGNVLDVLGICGGGCAADVDGDGICDNVDACVGALDACGVCNGPGAIQACGCSELPAGACDCAGNELDALGVCGGPCAADADADGICDNADACVGALDACGVCNGPGAVNACGCAGIPAGACDCAGNGFDALGVCGGACVADADADGICDIADACVGALDACGICNGPGAVLACGCSGLPAGACDCSGNALDALGICGGLCTSDVNGDGVCDGPETFGCTASNACNYSVLALTDDGSCEFCSCVTDYPGEGYALEVEEFAVNGVPGTTTYRFYVHTDAPDDFVSAVYGDENQPLELLTTTTFYNSPFANGPTAGGVSLAALAFTPQLAFDSWVTIGIDSAPEGEETAVSTVESNDQPWTSHFVTGTPLSGTDVAIDDFFGGGWYIINGSPNGIPEASTGRVLVLQLTTSGEVSGRINVQVFPEGQGENQQFLQFEFEGPGEFNPVGTPGWAGNVCGCMNATACNYDPEANVGDQAALCAFAAPGCSCDGVQACDGSAITFTCPLTGTALSCDYTGNFSEWGTTAVNNCSGATLPVATTVLGALEVENSATTSYGPGPDGAIRIFGMAALGLADSDYWIETSPFEVTRYSNGTARVTGSVVNSLDPAQGWDVHIVLKNKQLASTWMAGGPGRGLILSYGCAANAAQMDVYVLDATQSYLTGTGQYEGSYLNLTHMPVSQNKRFQLGVGGSSHNCNYGLGGWFAWSGVVAGMPVNGASGDLVVDLSADALYPAAECVNEEVALLHSVFDPACNQHVSMVQSVAFTDALAPEFVNAPEDVVVSCDAALPAVPVLVATDNCSEGAEVVVEYLGEATTPGTCPQSFTLTRSWRATDCSGNATVHVQTIFVEDVSAPVFTFVSPSETLDCGSEWSPMGAVASDACGDVTLTTTFEDFPGCGTSFDRVYTFIATDACGNAAIATATQSVVDTEAPDFGTVEDVLALPCEAVEFATVSPTDACNAVSLLTWTDAVLSTDCGGAPNLLRTYTAEDACGNQSYLTQAIVLIDTQAPLVELTCPPATTTEAGAACAVTDASLGAPVVNVTDNCDAAPSLQVSYADGPSVPGGAGASYTFERTFTVTAADRCDNVATAVCTQSIVVVDGIAPEVLSLECPSDLSIESGVDCAPSLSPSVTGVPTLEGSDNCDSSLEILWTYEDGVTGVAGGQVVERTFSVWAVDDAGNASAAYSCTQTITLIDHQPPVFAADGLIVYASCTELPDPTDPSFVPLDVTDNCDESLTISIQAVFAAGGCPGTWKRVWTATDDQGNSATAEQFVVLFDETPPAIAVPADAVVAFDAACTVDLAPASTGMAVATDDCFQPGWYDGIVLTYSDGPSTPTCGIGYSFVRTWTAVDNCQNLSTATQLITVVDSAAPVISFTAASASCATYSPGVDYGNATIADCDGSATLSWTDGAVSGACGTVERTYVATDGCGNAATATQLITIEDAEAPVIAAEPFLQVLCEEYPQGLLYASATDNCGETTLTFTDLEFAGGCVTPFSNYVRTYTATDACGNTSTFEQTILLIDHVAPAFTSVPADVTIACDEEVPVFAAAAEDNCDAAPLITWTDVVVAGPTPSDFTIVRTYAAVDHCGNTATAVQAIYVEDTTAPVLVSYTPALTISPEEWESFDFAYWEPLSSDNCDATTGGGGAGSGEGAGTGIPATVQSAIVPGPCAGTFTAEVTYTHVDASGNALDVVMVVNVVDSEAPIFTEAPEDLVVECGQPIPMGTTAAEDDGSPANLIVYGMTESSAPSECGAEALLTRTWTATDDCGNTAVHIQSIQIIDTTAPVFTSFPSDQTNQCAEQAYAYTAVDDCGDVTFSEARTGAADACGNYTQVVTITATDACGNSAAQSFTIAVADTEGPAFVEALPADAVVACDAVPAAAVLTAVDNCDAATGVLFSETTAPGTCANSYTLTRTWTSADCSGHATSHTQVLTVQDTTAPAITAANEVEIACGDFPGVALASATDACGTLTLSFVDLPFAGGCVQPLGQFIRTYSAVDACGNASTFDQIIVLTDDIAPEVTITCPADLTVALDAACAFDASTASLGEATAAASDNCGAAPAVVITYVDGSAMATCGGSFSFERTFTATATDACGNASSASCTQAITVVDTTAPEILAEPFVTVACDAFNEDVAFAGVNDGCSPADLTWTSLPFAGGCVTPYTNFTRVYVATDACGNAAEFEQVIMLIDTVAPAFTSVPGGAVVACDQPIPTETASASDNCDAGLEVVYEDVILPGISPNDYTIVRTFTATDHCGNSASATQTIEVVDEAAPTVLAFEPVVSLTLVEFNAYSSLEGLVTASVPGISDNCDDAPVLAGIQTAIEQGACPGDFAAVATYTFTDASGNATSVEILFQVEDVLAPAFVESLPASMAVGCDAVPAAATLSVTDDSGVLEVLFAEEIVAGSCANSYTVTRVWSATDCSGNAVSHTQILTVMDTTAPVFTSFPSDQTNDCSEAAYSYTAEDNCGDVTFSEARSGAADACGNYVQVVTITATDACGNSTSQSFTITVADTEAPAFVEALPADATVECDAVPSADVLTATDNCDAVSVSFTEAIAAGDCPNRYTVTRTWSATDCSGNATSHTQVLTVVDTTAPSFTSVPADVLVECDAPIPADLATAEDNCGETTVTFTDVEVPGISPNDYDILRTFTATDACGNAATVVQTIQVRDTEAPTVVSYVPTVTLTYQDILAAGGILNLVNSYQPLCVDNCDTTVGGGGGGVGGGAGTGIPCTMTYDSIPGDCYGNFTLDVLFTHADVSGNHLELVVVITVEDTEAPVIDFVPADATVACGEALPTDVVSASDAVSPAELLVYAYSDEVVGGTCASTYTIIRTHTAADDCGNVATATQTIAVVDTEAPEFVGDMPSDMTSECGEVDAPAGVVAIDACGADVVIDFSETSVEGECAGEEIITRTWTATDCAGNAATHVQTITVVDTTAPEVVSACTYDDGQIIELCFDDPQGNFDPPAPCNVTFADACGGAVTVTYEETIVGDGIATVPGVLNYCEPSNPAPLASGSCSNTAPHALRLINFPGGQFYLAQEGTVTQLADGRWILTQTVVHASNPNAGWNISMTYGPGMNWTQWLGQPGPQGYKFDCPILVDDHLNWTYRLLQSGTLTGWGAFAGSQFNLFHQPANGYFGMQLGHGASNLNNNYGYVGWFFMVGQHLGTSYSGTGDIFGDLNCAQPVSVERVYTATDCAGNSSQFSYTLLYNSANCDGSPVAPGTGNATSGGNGLAPSDGDAHGATQGTFRSAEVLPNPTQDATALRLVLDEEERVRVDVVSLTGATLLGEVFEGTLAEGMQHSIPLNVSGLAAGMYQVRVQSATRQSVVRLLIVD